MSHPLQTRNSTPHCFYRFFPALYAACTLIILFGYVRYDPYKIDGDAVSYMDISSSILHGRWHEAVNGIWNPGYPALLALGKLLTHADRFHELQVFYWVNYFVYCLAIACATYLVQSILNIRSTYTQETPSPYTWSISSPALYIAAYSIVFYSWQMEFSIGNVHVDGLFAAMMLLAVACLLRVVFIGSMPSSIGAGVALGIAYWVKSPGFVLGMLLLIGFYIFQRVFPQSSRAPKLLLASMIVFFLIIAPYVTALSLQKGRLDWGDSASLNYAWYVSGSEPVHILNDQPWRFGNASVHLLHPEKKILSDPVIVEYSHFPNASDGAWIDPSYYHDGTIPHFNLKLQIHIFLQQSRRFAVFLIAHGIFLIVLALYIGWLCFTFPIGWPRALLLLIWTELLFICAMYVAIHFTDRYVSGFYWIAWITTLGFFSSDILSSKERHFIEAPVLLLSAIILLLGLHAVIKDREASIFASRTYGWYQQDVFQLAKELPLHGIIPGSKVVCFYSEGGSAYWARLAAVHITAAIYDTRYLHDAESSNLAWESLPNKATIFQALHQAGIIGIVGWFDFPPTQDQLWIHLTGHYYLAPVLANENLPTAH